MTLLTSRVIRISVASLLTGLLIGVVGGAFRFCLIAADHGRDAFISWAHGSPHIGWVAPVALGLVGAALARLMVVRLAPEAEGSGVQRVEAVFSGEVKPARHRILPVKFVGGILAMGSGLALGREGPVVQMGASLSSLVSRFVVKHEDDVRVVEAAGAGAGLAVAFNAPISGSIFVFEELTSSFTPWLLVATLAAATFAVWIARLMLGNQLDFAVARVSLTHVWQGWPFLGLGVLLGAAGALYNTTIVAFLQMADRFSRRSKVLPAVCIGAVVGLAGWFAPSVIGGGDNLTQAILSGRGTIATLTAIFLLRFFLGPWSYAAGTPGGLFAPLLVLGASSGALFGSVLLHFFPALEVTPIACAVVGMGALFTACVRAPLTGIVLAVEMTGRGDLTLALLGACLVAMVVAMLLNSEPIYETLKRRMIERQTLAENTIARRA
jgi:chloride channel protein, CIC family